MIGLIISHPTPMKTHLALFLSLITTFLGAAWAPAKDFDDGYRFIFYAVQEGCYESGLTTDDVSQILLKDTTATNLYSHFVYACPVCTPTIHALEAYRSRPARFYSMKSPATTFGPGLSADLKKQLYSNKPEDRLAAINTLMQDWIAKRIALLRLSEPERTELQKQLEAMRKKGMSYLKSFEKDPSGYPVSAFATVHQCAACNGACGMTLKPAGEK